MVDAGHFWAQFADTETVNELQKLMDATAHQKPVPLLRSHDPRALSGCFCLAMYSDDNCYYRAKIEAIDNHSAQVWRYGLLTCMEDGMIWVTNLYGGWHWLLTCMEDGMIWVTNLYGGWHWLLTCMEDGMIWVTNLYGGWHDMGY